MKRRNRTITSLIAFGTIAVFLSGMPQQALAQQSFTEAEEAGAGPLQSAPAQQVVPSPATQTISFFNDRNAFNASTGVCALANESFQNTNAGPGSTTLCTGPFDSTSNDACYSPGALLPGFGVNNVGASPGMVVITPAAFGVVSTVVGPNAFADSTDITFSAGNIGAAGFDLVDVFGGSTWSIEFFDSGGSLGLTPATGSVAGLFIGASSSSNIVRIEIRPIGGTAAELIDNLCFGLTVLDVGIDIKPGSFPNSINSCSKGAIPIAILGSASLDVTTIDPSTLVFAGAGIKIVGKTDKILCSVEDVSGPPPGPGGATDPSGVPDGFDDLVCHFVTIELTDIASGDATAMIEGALFDGTPLEGTDSINIVKDDCL